MKNKIYFILTASFLYAAIGYSQGNWELLIPKPTSNQMTSLYFIDDQTGWSVGQYGTILKTTDGGVTWIIQQIPWLYDLNDVYFPTSHTGYAIGTDGFIIKTTDGGNTWNQLENQYSNNLNRIRFRDENTGWTIGEKGLILYTADGGAHWVQQTSQKRENLLGIDFIGSGGICVVGDDTTILITHDDGQTWRLIKPNIITPFFINSFALNDVFFLDGRYGWIAGDYDTHMALLKTEDSGETWSMRAEDKLSYTLGYATNPGGPALQQIYYYDMNMALGLCAYEEYVSPSNIILKTLNAGADWFANIYIYGYNEAYNGKGQFSILNKDKVICTGYHGDFRLSANQARSWYVTDEQQHWWDYLTVGNHGQLIVHQLIPSVTFHGSEIDHWFRSSDYGRTWSEFQQLYLDKNNQPIDIPNTLLPFRGFGNFIHNRDTLWITQRTGLYDSTKYAFISTDFGSTYHEIQGGISPLVSTFLTPDTMIGHSTYIIEQSPDRWDTGIQFNCSFDGGLTVHTFKSRDLWNKLTYTPYFPVFLPRLSINATYFFNGHKGFLVGSDGNIIGTNDTGQSWTNIYSGVVEDLRDITFINERTGFVVGDFGRILKTVDGGVTWYKTNSGTQEKIYSIGFINDHEGWVGTENGLRYTRDTGETWQGVPLRYSHGKVHQLLFDDAGNGYAYGNQYYYNSKHSGLYEFNIDNVPRSYVHLLRMLNNSTGIHELTSKPVNPYTMKLSQNYPNPFNASTRIDYYLPKSTFVRLQIFNLQGKLVRTLVNESKKSGQYSVIWNGQSANGISVSSGIYIYRLQCDGHMKSHKLLLLK